MAELCPGKGVYMYQYLMDSALNRESATAKATYLINCLYNKNKQLGMNLTGNSSKNQPRKEMDADIRDSIIGMVSIMILVIFILHET